MSKLPAFMLCHLWNAFQLILRNDHLLPGLQPAMMIKTASIEDGGEAAELPATVEDAKPPLEWTTEQQQQGVDVLMSSLDYDLSEEATPPEVSLLHGFTRCGSNAESLCF